MQGSQIILKIVIGGDCFRIGRFPASYSDLEDIVHSKYESRLPENFCFKYEDCDNDSINIESQSDYEACYEYCVQEQLKSIKFRVDSKSYKQYYNYNHPQPNSLTATIGSQQFAPQQTQNTQMNGALGVLVNPYMTSYQNITSQTKSVNKMSPRSSNNNMFTSNNNIFASCLGQQQFQPGTMESSQNQFLQMMMLLNSQGAFSNQFGSSLRMNSGNIGGGVIPSGPGNIITTNTSNTNNNNAGNNSGINTNAVNQSHSSQAHILLSKHTSEVHTSNDNPNSTFNNVKIQNSANQSQIEQLPLQGSTSQQQTLQGNMSFTNGRANLNSVSENSGQNNINFTFKASNKNAAWGTQDLNSTSKFFNQESKLDKQYTINQDLGLINIVNPMESDEVLSPLISKKAITSIKRTNSINPDQELDQNNPSGSQQIPLFLKAIKIGAGNNSGSSIVSQNVDMRQVSTAPQSNYSQNTLGISGNVGNLITAQTSQYSNQVTLSRDLSNVVIPQPGKGAQGNANPVSSEDVEDNKKRELFPSPPLFKLDSSNTLTANRIDNNRLSSLSTTAQRSGSNVQIPCEKCIIRSEELKLKEQSQYELKTPTNNALIKEAPFTPQSDCKTCQGTGFLSIDDNRVLNIIQSIIRQKLKESDIVLKTSLNKQQKIGEIIPKEMMSCLKRMLDIQEIDPKENERNELAEPTEQNTVASFIRSQKCWECKKNFENENYVYMCIDCKSQATVSSDTANVNSQNSLKQNNNDGEYLLCEKCEERHDVSHRVIQIQKEDKMVLNQQQAQQQIPRMNQLEKSIKIIPQTNFQTSQILSQPYSSLNGNYKTGLNNRTSTQERISNSKDNNPVAFSSDYHLQPSHTYQRHDFKSSTVIVNPPVDIITSQFDLMDQGISAKEPKREIISDNAEDNSQFEPSGRISSNHNFNPQNQLHKLFPGLNSNSKPPNENINLDNKIIESNEITIAPTIAPINQVAITPLDISPLSNLKVGSLAESQKIEQIQCDTQVLEIIGTKDRSKMQAIQQNNLETSQDIQKGVASNNTTLICLKSTFYSASASSSKLTSSYVFPQNRNSLTSSIVAPSSQYRAKLLLNFSSDILSDGSIVVFQEISNNGSENWPNDVFLQCISGLTDMSQYPAINVNKGEIMHIAFSLDIQNYLKIQKSQLAEGEQVKTSWRLYYQQVNFEKQFFGPKITIKFTYQKPQKSESEDTLESVSEIIHDTMKKIFTEDDQMIFQEFLEINKENIAVYLKEKKEDFTISKLIVQCIEQYVLYRIAKSKATLVDEKVD